MQGSKRVGRVTLAVGFLIVIVFVGKAVLIVNAQEPNNNDVSERIKAGKTIFDGVNCLMCHLLNGEGGGFDGAQDLAGIGTRRNQAYLRQWLNTYLFKEPHIDIFAKDPTDEDIEALFQYLLSLKDLST